jgi:hypothetical protein
MKYKNVGIAVSLDSNKAKLKNPEHLARYGNESKRTSKSNLSKGAFGKTWYKLDGEPKC